MEYCEQCEELGRDPDEEHCPGCLAHCEPHHENCPECDEPLS